MKKEKGEKVEKGSGDGHRRREERESTSAKRVAPGSRRGSTD